MIRTTTVVFYRSIPMNSTELKFLATVLGMIPGLLPPTTPAWIGFMLTLAQQIVGRLAGSAGLELPGRLALPSGTPELPEEGEMTPVGIRAFCKARVGENPDLPAVDPGF